MTFGENNKLETFEEKPIDAKSSNISLGIYVIKRTLLIKLLENAIPKGYYDFVKDIILRNKDKIDIYGYEFDGYWNTLNSVNSYMETNMDFLNRDVRKILTQEPFIASRDSLQYKISLMIWEKKGKKRKVQIEEFSADRRG